VSSSGRFEQIRGTASDLNGWRTLITGSQPSFQRIDEPPEGGAFSGRLTRQVLDRISAHLVEIKAERHITRRTEEHIRNTPENVYVVMFQVEGESVFTQAGSSATLHPGDYTISTSTVPYEWEFAGDFTIFMLRFPQTIIDAPPQSLLPLTGRALSSQEGFGRYLSPFVTSVVRDPDLLGGPVGQRVAQNLVDLFTTSFLAHLQQVTAGDTPTASLFQQLTDYIGNHLGEPDLDSAAVARANFISTRYVQSIFREHGTTVSSWVRERRLANTRRDLADPVLGEQGIGEIAMRWGFPDQAYFSRIFRQAFGESPKQWRARALHYAEQTRYVPAVADDIAYESGWA